MVTNTQEPPGFEELAADLAAGRVGEPIRLSPAELAQLADVLGGETAPKLHVVLLGRYAIASFPQRSSQRFFVVKLFGRRVRAADFDFAADAKVVGDTGPTLSFARFGLGALARHGWWFVTGWLGLWWLVMALGDYVFASRLAELALSGSVITFILAALFGRPRLELEQRDRLVATGGWQRLSARRRNVTRLLGTAAVLALAAVLFSHSTMSALEARGYFVPVTSAPARILLTGWMSAGSVMLLVLGLATLSDLRVETDGVLVEQEAAAALADAERGSPKRK